MPQLSLHHATIVDVLPDEQDGGHRTIILNVNEEDFFEMLDHVNLANIIKYLDMRMIPHRDAIRINITRIDFDRHHGVTREIKQLIERNKKHLERARKLMEKYYG